MNQKDTAPFAMGKYQDLIEMENTLFGVITCRG
jgi:hypothetical protein